MRELTYYELRVLIKNIVGLIGQEGLGHGEVMNVDWLSARCQEIISYVAEYNALKDKEDAA